MLTKQKKIIIPQHRPSTAHQCVPQYLFTGQESTEMSPLSAVAKKGKPPSILNVLQRNHWEHINFMLRKALLCIVRTAERITGTPLPTISDIYQMCCVFKVHSITKYPTQPSHKLFALLPSHNNSIPYRSGQKDCAIVFFLRLLSSLTPSTLGRKTVALRLTAITTEAFTLQPVLGTTTLFSSVKYDI